MKNPAARFFAFISLSVAMVLTVDQMAAQEGGTLSLGRPQTPSNVSVAAYGGSVAFTGATATTVSASSVLNLGSAKGGVGSLILGPGVGYIKAPALTGSAGDLKITASADGNTLSVRTKVAITNKGWAAAKHVLADVYLSDDATLDTAVDTKLTTLKLTDYVPDAAKLRRGETISLPIKRKVPTAAASFLEGKYLIAVLLCDAPKQPNVSITSVGEMMVVSSVGTNGVLNWTTVAVAPALSDLVLTAKEASTIVVDRPTSKVYSTDAIVPTGSLKNAGSGLDREILPGDLVEVQPGDTLQMVAGTTLRSVTGSAWDTTAGALNMEPGASAPAYLRLTDKVTTLSAPKDVTEVTPTNQVIIGPIHLP